MGETQLDQNGAVVPEETSIKLEADSKRKKWQTTIEIEQGSEKLKVKMPFNKSSLTSDASEGGNSVSVDDKKKN